MTQYNPKELGIDQVAGHLDDDIMLSRAERQSGPLDTTVTPSLDAAPDAHDLGARALRFVHDAVADRDGGWEFENIAEIEEYGLPELRDHAALGVMNKNCQEFEALVDEPDTDDLED